MKLWLLHGSTESGITLEQPTAHVSYRFQCPDGKCSSTAAFDDKGNLLRIAGVVVDITGRKKAKELLQASEERLRHLIDSSSNWVWEVDAQGVYNYSSPQCREILGYEPEEIVGKTPFDLMPPDESPRAASLFHVIVAERKAFRTLENIYMHKDGHVVVLESSGMPVIDKKGKFLGYRGVNSDINERKRVENKLWESEERFRLVANTAPVMIWMDDRNRLCMYLNQPWLEFTGRPIEAELGNGWTKGVHPEDLKESLDIYQKAFDQRQPFTTQYRLRRYDGEYRWLLDTGVPRFEPDGSFSGYIGSCIDVTDQKVAQEALTNMGRRLIEAHEEERTWIARELHDDINQRLALLAVELEQWNQHVPDPTGDLVTLVRHARQRLFDISRDVQSLSHRLHSSKLEYLGIAAAANSYCRELSEQHKVRVEFSHSNIPRSLSTEVALALFRVLQEALQNAVKHSHAREFKAELRGTANEMHLAVSDRGIGFDQGEAIKRYGLGLISMRERLRLVSGSLMIESKPGSGTTVRARVPVKPEVHRMSLAG